VVVLDAVPSVGGERRDLGEKARAQIASGLTKTRS
jgi:hypothetical protein